jgi:hypothetical protein
MLPQGSEFRIQVSGFRIPGEVFSFLLVLDLSRVPSTKEGAASVISRMIPPA